MTESDWLSANDPEQMLEFLRGKASSREFRLFAAACCRRIFHHLNRECRFAVEVAESYAEGRADDQQRKAAAQAVNEQCIYVDDSSPVRDRFTGFAAEAVLSCLFGDDDYPLSRTYAATCAIAAARAVIEVVAADCEIRGHSETACLEAVDDERRWQCRTIRERFGPFLDRSQ